MGHKLLSASGANKKPSSQFIICPPHDKVFVGKMLCFNLKLAAFFRAYKEESVRDRSQSLCAPPPRAAANRDIGALRVLQRRASSAM